MTEVIVFFTEQMAFSTADVRAADYSQSTFSIDLWSEPV